MNSTSDTQPITIHSIDGRPISEIDPSKYWIATASRGDLEGAGAGYGFVPVQYAIDQLLAREQVAKMRQTLARKA